MRLRILILQTQTLFGKALCALLASDEDLEVIGNISGIAELERFRDQPEGPTSHEHPSILLLDLDNYHDGPIVRLVDAIRTVLQTMPLCALAEHFSPIDVERSLDAGIGGLILKDVQPAELIRALKLVAQGDAYVDSRVAGFLLCKRSIDMNAKPALTVRETEVVRLIADGLSNKEIGVRLALSEKTVKSHLGHIFSKLKISGRTRAAIHALKTGLA
jgi:DNA-binding NarL/FixJ family response regulator